jgi:DNA-binding XRE family transcriptional regulator
MPWFRKKNSKSTQKRNFISRKKEKELFQEKKMSDLQKYIKERKRKDKQFAENYDNGYNDFKIGVLLRQAREDAGYTQEEIAKLLHTQKSAISRIENHAEDIRLSTLEKFAKAIGRHLEVKLA